MPVHTRILRDSAVFALTIVAACQSTSVFRQEIAAVVTEVELCCPVWKLGAEDGNRKQEILLHLNKIAQFDAGVIREAIRQLIASDRRTGSYDMDLMMKLFILNRFVCDVPQWVDITEAPRFGGWVGIPETNQSVSVLWPLKIVDSEGNIDLVRFNVGYFGDEFLALEELDFLRRKYGMRRAASVKSPRKTYKLNPRCRPTGADARPNCTPSVADATYFRVGRNLIATHGQRRCANSYPGVRPGLRSSLLWNRCAASGGKILPSGTVILGATWFVSRSRDRRMTLSALGKAAADNVMAVKRFGHRLETDKEPRKAKAAVESNC
jgi:hypothetical protein